METAVASKACAQLLDMDKDELGTARMGAEEIKQAA